MPTLSVPELLTHLWAMTLPTSPIRILPYATVTGSVGFLNSCERKHEAGDNLGIELLRAYAEKVALVVN